MRRCRGEAVQGHMGSRGGGEDFVARWEVSAGGDKVGGGAQGVQCWGWRGGGCFVAKREGG